MDLLSYRRWYDYSRARDAMLRASDSSWAPWFVADTNDKRRGRLNIISHLLSQVPYEPLTPEDAQLPHAAGCRRLRRVRPAPAPHRNAVLTRRHTLSAATVLRCRPSALVLRSAGGLIAAPC